MKDDSLLIQKLEDSKTSPDDVEYSPDEAEKVGAFIEDSLTEDDVRDSMIDNFDDEDN